MMRWSAPAQRHRNVPVSDKDGPAARVILAFAECPLLAINGHSLECTPSGGLHSGPLGMSAIGGKADEKGSKVDMKLPMSAFSRFTSVVGGKADIIRLRQYVRS